MATLTIKDIDDEVARRIGALPPDRLAAMNDRLKGVVAAFAAVSVNESRRQVAERISAMTPKGVPQTDSALLLREDRDR